MAIFHLTVKNISRSSGQSAIASIAYRRAERMQDDRYNKTQDYTAKQGVVHSEITIPNNAPSWVKERIKLHETDPRLASEKFWNFVELSETRKDARLAREIEFALPVELTQSQNISLAREYIQDQFASRGMVADWSVHWDKGNPHVHVMLTTRALIDTGFGWKQRKWNARSLVFEWREKWAEYANFHLKLNQHDVTIDHRSYQEQGIDLVPTVHQGPAVTRMHRQGIETDIMREANVARRENLSRITQTPEILLNKMERHSPTFSTQDIANELGRYVNDKGDFLHADRCLDELNSDETTPLLSTDAISDLFAKIEAHDAVFGEREIAKAVSAYTDHADLFAAAILELKASDQLISLGVGDDGRDKFTTRNMFELENKILQVSTQLQNASTQKIRAKAVRSTLRAYEAETGKTLTDEQRNAILHITQQTAISCLVGRAGTGKSFSLGAARQIWANAGLNIHGVALSGIAADGLSKDAGIDSRTIASFKYAIENQSISLDDKSVVVMDEAGMTDSPSMLAVLNAVTDAKAKLVLVGDHAQLQPVGVGASFRGILERVGFAEIQTIYRQKHAWQRQATVDLAAGRVDIALDAYDQNGLVHFVDTEDNAMAKLSEDWVNRRAMNPVTDIKEYLAIAYENKDVALLNQLLRETRVCSGEISEGYHVSTRSGQIKIATGDRLVFLKNDRRIGVSNGRFSTIESVNFNESGEVINFTAKLDESDNVVVIDPKVYKDFAHGYAATVYKVQGVTVDHTFNYIGKAGWNRNAAYVANSRHREQCDIYANAVEHKDLNGLKKILKRYGLKDSLLDFPLAFAKRRSIDTEKATQTLPSKLANRLLTFKEGLIDRFEQQINPKAYWDKKEALAQEQANTHALTQSRIDAKQVAHYVDMKRGVGMAYEALQTRLSDFGLTKVSYEPEAFEVISRLAEYKAFQTALTQRDEAAVPLSQSPGLFSKAFDIYGLDVEKIGQEAQSHERSLLVSEYQRFVISGQTVQQGRLAERVMQDIKGHYRHLKSAGVDTSELRKHALQHLKRKTLLTLSPEARKIFYAVERYQHLSKTIGKQYASLKDQLKTTDENKSANTTFIEVSLNQHAREREQLAAKILGNKSIATPALCFYQIETYSPAFGEVDERLLIDYQKQAENRLLKMEKSAQRHYNHERVKAYISAYKKRDKNYARQYAHEIVADIQGHHGAVLNNTDIPSIIWKGIRRDAQLYKRDRLFETLSPEKQANFLMVEAYVHERRQSAKHWAGVFEAKEAGLAHPKCQEKLLQLAKEPTLARDKLAFTIDSNADAFSEGIEFFNVNPDHLKKAAYAQICREYVALYQSETNVLQRAQIAGIIAQDPKAHHSAMIDAGVSWKNIYKDRMPAKQQVLFSTLSLDEKKLMRLAAKYQKANRSVGRNFSKIFIGKKKKHRTDPALQRKSNTLLAKRDYLAYRLNDAKQTAQFSDLLSNKENSSLEQVEKHSMINWGKIEKQSQKHTTRVSDINTWKSINQPAMDILPNVIQKGALNHNTYYDWLSSSEDAQKAAKLISYRINNYTYALQSVGTSKEKFQRQVTLQKGVKAALSQMESVAPETYQSTDISKRDPDLEKRIERARHIERGSKPIRGTLAERYLREHRGIKGNITKSYSYHPAVYNGEARRRLPALVVTAKNVKNETNAVQVIFLDKLTANKAKLNTAKLTFGSLTQDNTGVLVNAGKDTQTIAIAEGPETALSVSDANPDLRVYAVLGSSNFSRAPIFENTKKVLFCADNDGKNSASQKKLFAAAKTLSQRGVDVFQAMPEQEKQDFNDVLKHEGKGAVRTRVQSASTLKKGLSPQKIIHKLSDINKTPEDTLTPEREARFKTILKKYKSLKEAWENACHDKAACRTALEKYAHKINERPRLMQYIKEKFPNVGKNIQTLSHARSRAIEHRRRLEQNLEYDLDHDLDIDF